MRISVIIPTFNGEKTISELAETLMLYIKGYELEIVIVNDASSDNTHAVAVSLFEKYRDIVKYICLAKNFGEHNAVMTGLNYCTGDYNIIIDDDFQNPPSEIEKLINKAREGNYDVVYSFYKRRRHSWLRNLGSDFNNLASTLLLNKPKDLYLSSFKCLNRFIVREIIKYKGPFPYIDGLILRSTHNIGKTLVEHEKRKKGRSGYTLRKLVGLWLNMFINFSIVPLRISIFLGFLFLILGLFYSISIIIEKILRPDIPIGITSILVFILFFGGIQLLIVGLIGEYLGKLYLANNQTPQYVIRHIFTKDNNG